MNPTIAVALITSISTLAGASISGYITFLVSRTYSNNQLTLAGIDRKEQRSTTQRQIRRDVYVQYLNQLGVAEHAFNSGWRSASPRDLTQLPDYIEPVTIELNALERLANLVVLEGPQAVASVVLILQARLALESVKLIEAAKKSNGGSPCLQDDQEYIKLKMDSATMKSKVIKAAQDALNEAPNEPRIAAPDGGGTSPATSPELSASLDAASWKPE